MKGHVLYLFGRCELLMTNFHIFPKTAHTAFIPARGVCTYFTTRATWNQSKVTVFELTFWGLFLESPVNASGPKSQLSNCNPPVLKSGSFNMLLM